MNINDGLLVDMMGRISAGLLEEDYLEFDIQTNDFFLNNKYVKMTLGIVSSIIAMVGILLAIKLHKGNLVLPSKNKRNVRKREW